jgi:very-short-patch-repair endonuclease
VRDRNKIERAKTLRRALTPPEVALWSQLKSRRLDGLHFRTQHPVGPYILDFYCDAVRLAVEVDGVGHSMGDRPDYDARRDAWLLKHGIRTLRLRAADIRGDLLPIVDTIRAAVAAPSVTP